jgi:hypothetical protein
MRKLLLAATTLLMAAACSPGTPAAPAPPTLPPLSGTVEIDFPQDGTVIYAESLYVSGSASGVPDNQFTLKLVNADDQTLNQATVQVDDSGKWQVELVHGVEGEPSEMAIFAVPSYADAPAGSDYDIRSVVIASKDYRPEGVFGSILAPFEGSSVGGDIIPVNGTVSGVFEGEFTLELTAEDGTLLDSQQVLAMNPNFIDEVPWSAEIATQGYTGQATIRAYAISARDGSEIPLGSVQIEITRSAG